MYSKTLGIFQASTKVSFVDELLKSKSVANNLKNIQSHVFNQQLFDGTLSPLIFGKYLHDDYIYLHHYASALSKLSLRINNTHSGLAQHLNCLANDIIASEKDMQNQYKFYFSHTEESKPGRAISTYIDFLNVHAEQEDLPVALCSILPCFWIYYELGGIKLHPQQLATNPYKEWINTYSSASFIEATLALTDSVNLLAEQSTPPIRFAMEKSFIQAVEFELQFFNEVDPGLSPPSL